MPLTASRLALAATPRHPENSSRLIRGGETAGQRRVGSGPNCHIDCL
ncbi:MAG TPA: hypothetical protein VGN26_21330 [Armatimonadota bacterium]